MMTGCDVTEGGASFLGSLFGSTPLSSWKPLNVELMDRLFRVYKTSYAIHTVVNKLRDETLRGGVALRFLDGKPVRTNRADSDDPNRPNAWTGDASRTVAARILRRGRRHKSVIKGSRIKARTNTGGSKIARYPGLESSFVTPPPRSLSTGVRGLKHSVAAKPSNGKTPRKTQSKKAATASGKKATANRSTKAAGMFNGKGKNGHPWPWIPDSHSSLNDRQHEKLMAALRRAMLYGVLYGLVPVMADPDDPGAIAVPPVQSGRFVGRMSNHGKVEVGWQWRGRGLSMDSSSPSDDVKVFIWQDSEPCVGDRFPFQSVIQTLLRDIAREQELVDGDTQATYELNFPPFVLQENPRADRPGDARQIVEYFIDDQLSDPAGRQAGRGPGGTLSASQRQYGRYDRGGFIREKRSRGQGNAGYGDQGARIEIDACSGELIVVNRTVSWQRGAYLTPSGWIPTSSVPRPTLRNDLLAQRDDLNQKVANALGVPVAIAFGDTVGGYGQRGRGGGVRIGSMGGRSSTGRGYGGGGGGYQNDVCDKMRDTIDRMRKELSAFYGWAHYRLIWFQEAMEISRDVALTEHLMNTDNESAQVMIRQLELMGATLAREWHLNQEEQVKDMEAFERAAAITDLASKLWRNDVMQQQIDSVLGIIAGVWDGSLGTPGDMSAKAVHEREGLGEGFEPLPEDVLRDPSDDGDITKVPGLDPQTDAEQRDRRRKGSKDKAKHKDPNALAEHLADRRARTLAQGRRVAGSTLMEVAPARSISGYQRRALTEELPSLQEALARAEQIVDARLQQVSEVDLKRESLVPRTGDRGDTKVELVWRSPPKPDWPLLSELAWDGVLNPRLFQYMYLSHLGFNPDRMRGLIEGTDPFGPKSPRWLAAMATKAKPEKSKEQKSAQTKKKKKNDDDDDDDVSKSKDKEKKPKEKDKDGTKEQDSTTTSSSSSSSSSNKRKRSSKTSEGKPNAQSKSNTEGSPPPRKRGRKKK